MKKVIVISLGGSLIIPDDPVRIDKQFLKKFKKTIIKLTSKYKFIIVCGGGSIARKYISALKAIGANEKLQSFSGISATRMNARFVSYFFNKDAGYGIPEKMDAIKKYLKKQDIVFCGALEYKEKQTSDSTSAQIATHFKTTFINMTNVPGLHDKNPKEYRKTKLIPRISWKAFDELANKISFKPGQHFVLDQTASKIIKKNKIPTYIIGRSPKQIYKILNKKKFKGTLIKG